MARWNVIKIARRNERTVGIVKQRVSQSPNKGGGYNQYRIESVVFPEDVSRMGDAAVLSRSVDEDVEKFYIDISFQDGAHQEVGPNGILDDLLLYVIRQRMSDFAKGPYSCQENIDACIHTGRAIEALESRFKKRQKRGVAGKYEK